MRTLGRQPHAGRQPSSFLRSGAALAPWFFDRAAAAEEEEGLTPKRQGADAAPLRKTTGDDAPKDN